MSEVRGGTGASGREFVICDVRIETKTLSSDMSIPLPLQRPVCQHPVPALLLVRPSIELELRLKLVFN